MNQPYAGGAQLAQDPMTPTDHSQLNALALAHMILGGIGMVLSLFSLLYVFLGLAIVSGSLDMDDAPMAVGWLFFGMGVTFLILGEAMSIALFISGRHLKRRTGHTFSFVVACISCLSIPVGTILGILTIIVLNRPTVKAAYGKP